MTLGEILLIALLDRFAAGGRPPVPVPLCLRALGCRRKVAIVVEDVKSLPAMSADADGGEQCAK
jgi:hypothetical protein